MERRWRPGMARKFPPRRNWNSAESRTRKFCSSIWREEFSKLKMKKRREQSRLFFVPHFVRYFFPRILFVRGTLGPGGGGEERTENCGCKNNQNGDRQRIGFRGHQVNDADGEDETRAHQRWKNRILHPRKNFTRERGGAFRQRGANRSAARKN